MFDNLRNAFSNAAKSFGEKELKEKDIEDILFQLELSLMESDVALEVIDGIKVNLKEKLIGAKVDKHTIEKFVKNGARLVVKPIEGFEGRLIAFLMLNMKNTKCDLIELAEEKK